MNLVSTHQAANFFQKAILYVRLIASLNDGLERYKWKIRSQGFRLFANLISQITSSNPFKSMVLDIVRLEN